MAQIGLFYGSNHGNTEYVAYLIKDVLEETEPGIVTVTNIIDADPEDLLEWQYLILGIPTWDIGLLQEDWDVFLPNFDDLDLSGRKVAIFGLGDQYGYPTTYLDAVGVLGKKVVERGAELVGYWPTEGYMVDDSLALDGDHFMGLAIDEDNEGRLTEGRVREWVRQILLEFGIATPTQAT